MKKSFIYITLLFICMLSGFSYAQTITGKHSELNFNCSVCHGDANPPIKRAPISSCLTCHNSYEAVAALTADVEPNPHQSHQGDVRCTLCHKSHEPSVLYCNECHQFDLQIK